MPNAMLLCFVVVVISATLQSLRIKLKKIEHAYWLQAGYISLFPTVTRNPGHVSSPSGYSSKLIQNSL